VHAARSSNKKPRSARPRMSSIPVAYFHVSCNMHAYNDPQTRFPYMQRSPLCICPTPFLDPSPRSSHQRDGFGPEHVGSPTRADQSHPTHTFIIPSSFDHFAGMGPS
jgi:hypothetical protein